VTLISGPRSERPMGLESAERRLLGALRAHPGGPALDLRVVGGRGARRHARALGARWHPAPPGRMPRRAWHAADLVHLVGLDLPPPPRPAFVATIHDLAALCFGDEGDAPPWLAEVARRAARVVTPSRFTAGELGERLGVAPERIRVIPIGPGQPVSPDVEPLTEHELAALGLDGPFVLRTGGYTERKNVGLLLAAWPEVRRRTGAQLALAGPAHAARAKHLAQAPSLDGVVVLDYLPAASMPGLLRAARALVSTSTYEGFGLPPLEAMAAATPVVAVRAPFVEEVCAQAAVLVDPEPRALAEALVRTLEDEAMRERLVAEGLRRAAAFTWPAAASALIDVYRELELASA